MRAVSGPNRSAPSYVFGSLPRGVIVEAREKLGELHQSKALKFVPRATVGGLWFGGFRRATLSEGGGSPPSPDAGFCP